MINSNNFLRWEGVLTPIAFTLHSDPVSGGILYSNVDSVDVFPLSLITATNGLDYTSFEIVDIKDYTGSTDGGSIILQTPPKWDYITHTLTCFRPVDLAITYYDIQFKFKDLLGNPSFLTRQIIEVSPIAVTWVPYPSSVACVVDNFGNQTGFKMWASLELDNMATGTPISPLTIKDNNQGDPDYYPPIQDYGLCAPAGAGTGNYSPLVISNFTKNSGDAGNFITITSIFLSSSNMGPGGTPITLNIPCDIPPNKTVRFMLSSSSIGFTYDGGITISYVVTGDMITASPSRYWLQNNAGVVTGFGPGGGGLTSNLVDNTGALALGGTFTLPSPSGVTIFAQ